MGRFTVKNEQMKKSSKKPHKKNKRAISVAFIDEPNFLKNHILKIHILDLLFYQYNVGRKCRKLGGL